MIPHVMAIIAVLRDVSVTGAALFLVWRVAYAAGMFAKTQDERTKIEGDMLSIVREFIETQKETNKELHDANKHLSVAIEVHAARLNKVEDRLAHAGTH